MTLQPIDSSEDLKPPLGTSTIHKLSFRAYTSGPIITHLNWVENDDIDRLAGIAWKPPADDSLDPHNAGTTVPSTYCMAPEKMAILLGCQPQNRKIKYYTTLPSNRVTGSTTLTTGHVALDSQFTPCVPPRITPLFLHKCVSIVESIIFCLIVSRVDVEFSYFTGKETTQTHHE